MAPEALLRLRHFFSRGRSGIQPNPDTNEDQRPFLGVNDEYIELAQTAYIVKSVM